MAQGGFLQLFAFSLGGIAAAGSVTGGTAGIAIAVQNIKHTI